MAVKRFSPRLRFCIAVLLFAPFCSASPKSRLAKRPSMTQPIGLREWSNVSFPITQAPPDPSSTVLDLAPTLTCTTFSTCELFYQYVSIYYWPSESQNTACLASLAFSPATATPPGLHVVSPSIYAVFPSIMASDGCKQIGKGYGPITTSFAPGEVSTIDPDGVSRLFDFADLPCPPSGIDVASGNTYAPLISPPSFIWGLDQAFSNCMPARDQGKDPPHLLSSITSGVGDPGSPGVAPPRRARGEPAGGPTMTPGPTLKAQL